MSKTAYYRIDDVVSALQCEPDMEEVASALSERDYRVFEVEQPPGAFVPYHAHGEEETIVILDGRMQFNVEEEIVPIVKGEMITIRAQAIHAAATVGGRTAKLLIAFGARKPSTREADAEADEDDSLGS